MSGIDPELALVTEFLAEVLPFDSLTPAALADCARHIEISYYSRGHRFDEGDGNGLLIIRSGAVDEHDDSGIQQRLESGESFCVVDSCGNPAATGSDSDKVFSAVEDCLIYHLPPAPFAEIRDRYRHIGRFFHVRAERRLRRSARYRSQPAYFSRRLVDVMSRNPLSVPSSASIREAARAMTERRVSSVFVLEDGQLQGVVTDRDMRSRVVAGAIAAEGSIAEVMSPNVHRIDHQASLLDAVMLMSDCGVHHLPVVDEAGQLTGVLSTSDIHLAREDDPLFFVGRLKRATSLQELQRLMGRLPELFRQWVEADTPSHQISRLTTAVSDALTRTLIVQAVAEMGPPPARFCWLGFGSQARGEQLLGGDQDNGLLIDGELDEVGQNWFVALAKRVCDGLDACGYDYCPGGVMASTAEWRKSLTGWREMVDGWMRSPTPDAVMRISIFFDLRPIYGDTELCAELQRHMLERGRKNTIFLAALAENVLSSTPPLGLFGRLLLERSGSHNHELDLKKRGILPIVELVRLHALANGIVEVNTHKRLAALAESGALSLVDSRNMEDAYTLINAVRLKQQALQLQSGLEPNNFLDPNSLSRLQRQHLKQAFRVVHEAQEVLRLRYRAGL